MKRGILFATAALAVLPSVPAVSLPTAPPYVVYEVYRVRPGGPAEVPVKMEVRAANGWAVASYAQLTPNDDGDGYEVAGMGVAEAGSDGRTRTYGMPVALPPCPAACGSAGGEFGLGAMLIFRPRGARDRLLVAGPRGRIKVTVYPGQWRAKATSLGMSVVDAEHADATGVRMGGTGVEHFRAAIARGGPYGSAAFAEAPCDMGAGAAQFTAPDGGMEVVVCSPVTAAFTFGESTEKGTWAFTGDVVGTYFMPLRLLVLDYPKFR